MKISYSKKTIAITLFLVFIFSSGIFAQGKSGGKKKDPSKGKKGIALVNINTATEKELVTLKRIGKKYARRIIEYREENGPFNTPMDIMKVPGIGQKTYQMNKDRIVVSD